MNTTKEILQYASEFVMLQERLLSTWFLANIDSQDMESLIDFPKHSVLPKPYSDWKAIRHGLGVRFERSDGLVVDVPFGIKETRSFDSNRLFDFAVSTMKVDPSRSVSDRKSFYHVFDSLCDTSEFVLVSGVNETPLYRLRDYAD
jgi:hypothetical protein